MSAQILATKLYTPMPRSGAVQRSRLIERLNAGLRGKLTLVSAPAGFGKTTLITEWLPAVEHPIAWLSLDAGDSEPSQFFRYIVAALQTVAPDLGQGLLSLVELPQPPPLQSLMTPLLNKIAAIPHDIVFVMDDYHIIDNQEIDAALAFLIDNQPPQFHLVITTREDPHLPLARLRVRGELTELRAADLRFTSDEASSFFNQAMGLSLLPEHIAALETRTEGWIAGLQLAAISMQGQQDTDTFIQSFTGSHHFVLDYLVEEVLSRQPSHIQVFLLYTSILERVSSSLCEAVLQDTQYPAQQTLEHIQQANLFLIPLDNERRWFRYHHLFGDLLRKRLAQATDVDVKTLHIRASDWYEQNDQRSEAIHHALAAEDFERAADMIEQAWAASHGTAFQNGEQHGWMQALPMAVYHNRPVLSAAYGWVLLDFGDLDAAGERLGDAEYWLDIGNQPDHAASEMIVVDQSEFQRLPATVASARAFHALALGDIPNTIKYGQQVLALVEKSDHHRRGIATSIMGLAHWYTGNLETAYQFMAAGMEYMYKLGNIHFALSSTFGLADILLGQGRLLDAIALYKQCLHVAESQPYVVQGIADLYMGLGDLYREQNDLEIARDYLNKSEALGKQAGLPDWRVRFCKIQARMKQISGDFDEALDLLNEAERLYYITPVPNIRPIEAMKARVWIAQGHLDHAIAWASRERITPDDDTTFLREFELITLVRLHMAQLRQQNTHSHPTEVIELLERLQNAAQVGKRHGSLIEILILQVLLQQLLSNIEGALTALQQALQIAEPEGYVRLFIDEGPPMRAMLSTALEHGITPTYTQKLITAFEPDKKPERAIAAQPLIDPLSDRELEILRLVADGLSNREIANRLYLALDTIKGHNRRIYAKLGVKRRTEAVAHARDVGLI
ncbi:MAG: LuxR C-terminal-related transcriptional regulator [Chloroflexota bacterium]